MICSAAAECSSSRNLGFLRRIRSLGHSLRHLTFVRTVIAFSVGTLPLGGRVADEAVAAEAAKNIFDIVIG